jgi:hypothetical protein
MSPWKDVKVDIEARGCCAIPAVLLILLGIIGVIYLTIYLTGGTPPG